MKYHHKFKKEDQKKFARLSGDYNPLHVDSLVARRLMFGQSVVHGIHCLLWALDVFTGNQKTDIKLEFIHVTFLKPVFPEQTIIYLEKTESPRRAEIQLKAGDRVVCHIKVFWEKCSKNMNRSIKPFVLKKCTPRCLSDREIKNASGRIRLCIEMNIFVSLFPNLARHTSVEQIVGIIGTSRLVGMECPGLNSLYSELEVYAGENEQNQYLEYTVSSFDERYRLVLIQFNSAGLNGQIKAFVRPSPQKQASFKIIKNHVKQNQFAGQRALIVGGTRGIGEVTAKLLAAGGADIKITYCQGKKEADHIVNEIILDGEKASAFKFDVLDDNSSLVQKLGSNWQPTHLYYFATPFIFSGEKGVFSSALFENFCNYYVIRFMNIVEQLIKQDLVNIFYPSTVAIDEIPFNMREYTAAKAAGEIICKSLREFSQGLNVHIPRFPRLATDQTMSLLQIDNKDPIVQIQQELISFKEMG